MSVLKIFGQGNPLLDISAPVPVELLTKYDLQPSNAILAEDKHLPLYEELAAMPDVQYIPGGATLNSIRVANWMLQDPGHCSYVGCIGKDRFGDIMLKKCQDEGLTVPFMISETVPTGTCGVLVTGIQRSLVANLGAANAFKEEHYEQSPVAKTAMETADILYSAGFFLTVSVPSVIRAGKYALANNKTLVLNFSAPFIVQFFGTQLTEVMPYVDILVSNDDEAKQYAAVNNLGLEAVADIAKHCVTLPKAGPKPRMVIITCGKEATVVATAEGVKTFDVPPVENIIDTNGAGDSFVGGFLAYMAKGADLETCVKAGHYAAGVIIQHSGCTFPAKPAFSP